MEYELKAYCDAHHCGYEGLIKAIKRAEKSALQEIAVGGVRLGFGTKEGKGRGGVVRVVWEIEEETEGAGSARTSSSVQTCSDNSPHPRFQVGAVSKAELKAKVCMLALGRPKNQTLEGFVASLGAEFRALKTSGSNLKRWLRAYQGALGRGGDGVEALRDTRGRPRGNTALREAHQKSILMYLARQDIRPTTEGIYAQCKLLHGDLPSLQTVARWITRWKRENPIEWGYLNNPDGAKNKYLPAFGSASEAFTYPNAGWELDATKADVMCSDGRRWQIYGLIDIYSRRVVVTMEKETSSYGVSRNLREGMLRLGIPELLITDNGRDYTSNHIDEMCLRMGIGKREVAPYSGQKKPHIERFFGTLTRGLFTRVKGFVEHSVAGRQELKSRRNFESRLHSIAVWKAKQWGEKSFSDALLRRENAELFVEVPVSSDELRGLLDEWVVWYENVHLHRGIQSTPIAKWKEKSGGVREVANVRMLDLMMGESSLRTVSKEGIVLKADGLEMQYAHSALVAYIGQKVKVVLDDALRSVHVYEVESGAYLCEAHDWAINPEAQRGIIKSAHTEHRKIQAKASKQQREAARLKDEADSLTSAAFSESLKRFTNDLSNKEKTVESDKAQAPSGGVKKYDGLVDRFVSRLRDGSWNEKDDALASKHRDLYEMALLRVSSAAEAC